MLLDTGHRVTGNINLERGVGVAQLLQRWRLQHSDMATTAAATVHRSGHLEEIEDTAASLTSRKPALASRKLALSLENYLLLTINNCILYRQACFMVK